MAFEFIPNITVKWLAPVLHICDPEFNSWLSDQ
jgi:hypothetical protein